MASALVAFSLKLGGKLVGIATDRVEMLLGVPGEITKLETTLGDIQSILADAETLGIQSILAGAERRRTRRSTKQLKRWVRELKDVMYDADDILDLCQLVDEDEDDGPRTTPACWNDSKFCLFNPIASHEIGKKIKALNRRPDSISKRSSRLGLISQAIHCWGYSADNDSSSSPDNSRKTGPSIVTSDIVGEKIVQDKRKLVDLLVNEVDAASRSSNDDTVVVVAITGVGGIGKTTLARMVFNDTALDHHFKKIWLSVNQDVNKVDLLQHALANLGVNYQVCAKDIPLLEGALKNALKHERFLLVMDDVWSDKVWNDLLRVPFNSGASGSRVLVTTRDDGVARGMEAHHVHRVNKLERFDAWSLHGEGGGRP